jgi:hypothetical protein
MSNSNNSGTHTLKGWIGGTEIWPIITGTTQYFKKSFQEMDNVLLFEVFISRQPGLISDMFSLTTQS